MNPLEASKMQRRHCRHYILAKTLEYGRFFRDIGKQTPEVKALRNVDEHSATKFDS